MPLPANFSGYPKDELHRYFRNLCIEFKKVIHASKNSDDLLDQMERFMNASKEMDWHHHTTGVYRKDAGEKAVGKVWSEFKRYIHDLQVAPETAVAEDLLDSLAQMEQLIESLKAS
jgi:hypothetical protein